MAVTSPSDQDRDLSDRLRELERMLEVVDSTVDGEDEALLHRLEEATADLHALLGGSIAAARNDSAHADLDAAVEHVLRTFVPAQSTPLVVRQHLCGRNLPVACSRDELLHAIRRALDLCARGAAPGATLDVATSEDGDGAMLTVACDEPGEDLAVRSVTLRDFAKAFRGRCSIANDARGAVRLSLAFPLALELG